LQGARAFERGRAVLAPAGYRVKLPRHLKTRACVALRDKPPHANSFVNAMELGFADQLSNSRIHPGLYWPDRFRWHISYFCHGYNRAQAREKSKR
jgi:hypothetical protein